MSRKFGINDCKPEPRIYCNNIDCKLYILGITHRKLEGTVLVFAKDQDKLLILGRILEKLTTLLTDISNRGIDRHKQFASTIPKKKLQRK